MTAPALIWFVLSRTSARLVKWVLVALVVGFLGALLGSLLLTVCIVGYAGWLSYKARPVSDLVAAPINEDRYRAHFDRVLSSLPVELDQGDGPAKRASAVVTTSSYGTFDVPAHDSVSFQ